MPWHLNIWKVKIDYLKNEKSFQSEIKNIFLVLKVLSFRHTKQTSKNVADTTFKLHVIIRIYDFL